MRSFFRFPKSILTLLFFTPQPIMAPQYPHSHAYQTVRFFNYLLFCAFLVWAVSNNHIGPITFFMAHVSYLNFIY